MAWKYSGIDLSCSLHYFTVMPNHEAPLQVRHSRICMPDAAFCKSMFFPRIQLSWALVGTQVTAFCTTLAHRATPASGADNSSQMPALCHENSVGREPGW